MQRILSWNVLYRPYEVKHNPKSHILSLYPQEKNRVNAILCVLKMYVDKEEIVTLQEVSTPVVNALYDSFSQTHQVFTYHICKDVHLVTLAPHKFNFKLEYSYTNSVSKGFLSIVSDTFRLINCHLIPQRYTKENVMEYLYSLFTKDKPTCIAGDFNARYNILKMTLWNTGITCPYYGKTYKKKALDHIVFDLDSLNYKTRMIYQDKISDHNLIQLEIQIR